MNDVSCIASRPLGLYRLGIDLLREIGSYLSDEELTSLAKFSEITEQAVRFNREFWGRTQGSLQGRIRELPQNPFDDEEKRRCFQRLLVDLIVSPLAGRPTYWIPAMDCFMEHLGKSGVEQVEQHSHMAALLESSETSISFNEGYRFFIYLIQNHLNRSMTYRVYRCLEKYTLQPKLHEASAKALQNYLTQAAEGQIRAEERTYTDRWLGNNPIRYRIADIDPRNWFGLNGDPDSPWILPDTGEGEFAPIPEVLLKVLSSRVQSLADSDIGVSLLVNMNQRAESRFPYNFTLPLAERITYARVFLEHHNTIDVVEIVRVRYAQGFNGILDEEERKRRNV